MATPIIDAATRAAETAKTVANISADVTANAASVLTLTTSASLNAASASILTTSASLNAASASILTTSASLNAASASILTTSASLNAATASAALLWTWDTDLPQDAGNTVFVERYAIQASTKASTVAVMVPTLGSSSAGTYVFDVLKNGTSILTGAINLETLVGGTWHSSLAIKTDGTENFALGDKLRAHAVSDNADLTGYTDGVFFSLGFTAQ